MYIFYPFQFLLKTIKKIEKANLHCYLKKWSKLLVKNFSASPH